MRVLLAIAIVAGWMGPAGAAGVGLLPGFVQVVQAQAGSGAEASGGGDGGVPSQARGPEAEVYRVTGYGAAPADAESEAQARLLAVGAAKLDALKKLAALLEGASVSAESVATNHVQSHYQVEEATAALLRGVRVLASRYREDGSAEVDVELVLSEAGGAEDFGSLDGYRIERVPAASVVQSQKTEPKPRAVQGAVESNASEPDTDGRVVSQAKGESSPTGDESVANTESSARVTNEFVGPPWIPAVDDGPVSDGDADSADENERAASSAVGETPRHDNGRDEPDVEAPEKTDEPEPSPEPKTEPKQSVTESASPADSSQPERLAKATPSAPAPSIPTVDSGGPDVGVSLENGEQAGDDATETANGPVTDLVLDARGIGLALTAEPKVYVEGGTLLYPFEESPFSAFAPKEEPEMHYARSLKEARGLPGFGARPLVVEVDSVTGSRNTDPVLAARTLFRLQALASSRLRDGEGYVVILTDY